jgi:hypothetical protein
MTIRSRETPPTSAYYATLERILVEEAKGLTAVIPHLGERGRNDEGRVVEFLRRVLPQRFSIGTGFITSSDRDLPQSRQIDIVLYDAIWNAPLYAERATFTFPIEAVYATVEVKGRLTKEEIESTLESLSVVRRLAEKKLYVEYGETQLGEGEARGPVIAMHEVAYPLAPRAFIFSYDTMWETMQGFVDATRAALAAHSAHLHGVMVLSKGWYLYQVARQPQMNPKVKVFSDHALMRFTRNMLSSISSMHMGPAVMHRYLDPGEEDRGEHIATVSGSSGGISFDIVRSDSDPDGPMK